MDKTKMALEVFDNCANEYQDKFMEVDLYKDSLDLFCRTVEKENASVLDLACGPGNITKYLLKQRPDFKIRGIDLSGKMIELAKVNNPAASFEVMDCRNIGSLDEKFEAITAGFCLPYLSKEEALKLIADASKLLISGGVLYLSTMEDDYGKSGLKKSSSGKFTAFIHFHQADYLTDALTENGFELLDISRKTYSDQSGLPVTDLLLIAKKHTL